jgi:hypothetical protein
MVLSTANRWAKNQMYSVGWVWVLSHFVGLTNRLPLSYGHKIDTHFDPDDEGSMFIWNVDNIAQFHNVPTQGAAHGESIKPIMQ